MSLGCYDRDGKEIDVETFERLFQDKSYQWVEKTHIGPVQVSTVWLGFDHSFMRDGPPLIFETMVFGGASDQECWRWSTDVEARAGHALVVAGVRLDWETASGRYRHGQTKHARDLRRAAINRYKKELRVE